MSQNPQASESPDIAVIVHLRRLDPAGGLAIEPSHLRVLLHDSIVNAGRGWRPRLFAVIAGVIVVTAAFGVASPAIASGVHRLLAQTGWFGPNPNPPGTEIAPTAGTDQQNTEADDSEWIEVTSPDYVEFSVSVFPEQITLPPQYDRLKFATVYAHLVQASYPGPGVVQVTGIQSDYENYARCAWEQEWLQADAAADGMRAATAADNLLAAATWPATVATDGGGVVAFDAQIAAAAQRGDRDGVLADPNCAPMVPGITK